MCTRTINYNNIYNHKLLKTCKFYKTATNNYAQQQLLI